MEKNTLNKTERNEKIFTIIRITVFAAAITELALSQFSIRITRLSAEELTGISYFAFIIFGLVTLFSVSKIRESAGARFFAIIMNSVTAISGFWCLRLLFSDGIFIRNLFYYMNRLTESFELLPLGTRIASAVPLAVIILGTAAYLLCAIGILIAGIVFTEKKKK
ncbi:MAG: hypothetical protein FWB73_06410 [Treponema sp.]|nr:hypothetical protein [Treponema sp.]